MKKAAVILSGCGFKDGSEIHESVLSMLALANNGFEIQCLGPNISQTQVVNHFDSSTKDDKRSILEEAARIARGNILDISKADPSQFDVMVFPGGYGAAGNLSNFSSKGVDYEVNKDVLSFAQKMAQSGKPGGFVCIAPTLIPAIYGKGVKLTVGNDQGVASQIEALGCIHENCAVNDIVIDSEHKVVSTPAYMLAKSISEVAQGVGKMVKALSDML